MSGYVLAGFILFGLLAAAYLVICAWKRDKPDLVFVGGLLLGAIAATGGVRFMVLALHDLPKPLTEDDRVPMFIGGLASCWVSIELALVPMVGHARKGKDCP